MYSSFTNNYSKQIICIHSPQVSAGIVAFISCLEPLAQIWAAGNEHKRRITWRG